MIGKWINNPLINNVGSIHHNPNQKPEKHSRPNSEFPAPPGIDQKKKCAKDKIDKIHQPHILHHIFSSNRCQLFVAFAQQQ
jgi:hypothetical protein